MTSYHCFGRIVYVKHGKVSIQKIKNRGTNKLIKSCQNGGKPGTKVVMYVKKNTKYIARFFCKKLTNKPVTGYVASGTTGAILQDNPKYNVKRQWSIVEIPFNSGPNNFVFIGLRIINAEKNDKFIVSKFGLVYG